MKLIKLILIIILAFAFHFLNTLLLDVEWIKAYFLREMAVYLISVLCFYFGTVIFIEILKR